MCVNPVAKQEKTYAYTLTVSLSLVLPALLCVLSNFTRAVAANGPAESRAKLRNMSRGPVRADGTIPSGFLAFSLLMILHLMQCLLIESKSLSANGAK